MTFQSSSFFISLNPKIMVVNDINIAIDDMIYQIRPYSVKNWWSSVIITITRVVISIAIEPATANEKALISLIHFTVNSTKIKHIVTTYSIVTVRWRKSSQYRSKKMWYINIAVDWVSAIESKSLSLTSKWRVLFRPIRYRALL